MPKTTGALIDVSLSRCHNNRKDIHMFYLRGLVALGGDRWLDVGVRWPHASLDTQQTADGPVAAAAEGGGVR